MNSSSSLILFISFRSSSSLLVTAPALSLRSWSVRSPLQSFNRCSSLCFDVTFSLSSRTLSNITLNLCLPSSVHPFFVPSTFLPFPVYFVNLLFLAGELPSLFLCCNRKQCYFQIANPIIIYTYNNHLPQMPLPLHTFKINDAWLVDLSDCSKTTRYNQWITYLIHFTTPFPFILLPYWKFDGFTSAQPQQYKWLGNAFCCIIKYKKWTLSPSVKTDLCWFLRMNQHKSVLTHVVLWHYSYYSIFMVFPKITPIANFVAHQSNFNCYKSVTNYLKQKAMVKLNK